MEFQFGYYPQVIPLVLARVIAVMTTVPFFGAERIGPQIKIVMALVVSMVLLPVIPPEWTEMARGLHTLPEFLLALLSEVLLGAAVGLVCHIFQAACNVAGSIQGRSSSLMMARAMDPLSGGSSAIMTTVLQMLFVVMVLLTNGHLMLLKLVSVSFTTIGQPMQWMDTNFFGLLFSVGEVMFDWGLKLALPVLCAGLIIDVCLGLVGRLAPDFNVLFLGLPIRLSVGICLFGFVIRFSHEQFSILIEQMLLRCANVFGV